VVQIPVKFVPAKQEHICQSGSESGPGSGHFQVKVIHVVPFLLGSGLLYKGNNPAWFA